MAKGKHAVALFEVIQSGKSSGRGSSLRTPKWWFKRRQKAMTDPTASAAASPAGAQIDQTDSAASAPAPRHQGIDLRLDSESQRISFHFTYTSALVTAFTVLVVVGLAYIIGRHVAAGPSLAVAGPSTEQIRRGPVREGVLDVKPAQNSGGATRSTPAPTPIENEEALTAVPPAPHPAPTATEPAAQRVIGRNYVIVQGYPDEKDALAARDLLNSNGVPCTVEKDLPGWAITKNWYIVVGLTGFDRPRNNPEYDAYEKKIRELSNQFARNSKFKKFEPHAYRWRG